MNLLGSAPSCSATADALSPLSASLLSRALRAVIKATSDIANKPLSRISPKSTAISMVTPFMPVRASLLMHAMLSGRAAEIAVSSGLSF